MQYLTFVFSPPNTQTMISASSAAPGMAAAFSLPVKKYARFMNVGSKWQVSPHGAATTTKQTLTNTSRKCLLIALGFFMAATWSWAIKPRAYSLSRFSCAMPSRYVPSSATSVESSLANKALKGVARADSMVILAKLQTSTSKFKIQFNSCADCVKATEVFGFHFPIKVEASSAATSGESQWMGPLTQSLQPPASKMPMPISAATAAAALAATQLQPINDDDDDASSQELAYQPPSPAWPIIQDSEGEDESQPRPLGLVANTSVAAAAVGKSQTVKEPFKFIWEEVKLTSPERSRKAGPAKSAMPAPPPIPPKAAAPYQPVLHPVPPLSQSQTTKSFQPAATILAAPKLPGPEETMQALPRLLADPTFLALVSQLEGELQRLANFANS
eukprot:m.103896 g.103896  ORF g.103896 m.103896 type:complete len:388 (-) comp14158_c0_seq13:93-1256(-)